MTNLGSEDPLPQVVGQIHEGDLSLADGQRPGSDLFQGLGQPLPAHQQGPGRLVWAGRSATGRRQDRRRFLHRPTRPPRPCVTNSKSCAPARRLSARRSVKAGPTSAPVGFPRPRCRCTIAPGNIIGTFGISRDITQRKLAEMALRNSEERTRLDHRYGARCIYRHEFVRLDYRLEPAGRADVRLVARRSHRPAVGRRHCAAAIPRGPSPRTGRRFWTTSKGRCSTAASRSRPWIATGANSRSN